MNFVQRVIVIPEKLTAWAAAGILALMIQLSVWLTNLTGIDFTTISFVAFATAVATILTMVVKAIFEKFVPETWHTAINSFLEWLATVLVANFFIQNIF